MRVCAPRILLLCLALAGCASNGSDRMSPDDLHASIRAGTAPTIVDVRTAAEYDSGHVPGAVHVPFYAVWSRGTALPPAKTDTLVVYCAHGPRAGLAKFGLWTAGYDDVRYLDGHMAGWKRRGLPLETGAR